VSIAVIISGSALGVVAHRRAERGMRALVVGHSPLPDARLLFAVSAIVATVAMVALVSVVVMAATR
jgi:hypothetical protein